MVLGISRSAVRVVVRFDHLGAQIVASAVDPVSVLVVEIGLVGGRRGALALGIFPVEAVGTDMGRGRSVSGVTPGSKSQTEVHQVLVVKHQSAEDEVAAVEAGQVLGVEVEGLVVVVGQEGDVGTRAGVGGQVGDGGVGSELPALEVVAKVGLVVDVHLDQVLVEGVGAAGPGAAGVEHLAGADVEVGADQSRPGLVVGGFGVDQVAVALVGELAVGWVAGEVGQTLPLEDQGTDGGRAVGGAAITGWGSLQVDAIVGHARGSVEGNLEGISEALGLLENSVKLALVGDKLGQGSAEQIVSWRENILLVTCRFERKRGACLTSNHATEVTDGGLEERNISVRVSKVNTSNVVQDLVYDILVLHENGSGEGVDSGSTPAVSTMGKTPC